MNEENNTPLIPSDDEDEYLSFTFKKTSLMALLFPVFFLLGLIVGYLNWGRAPQAVAVNEVPAQVPSNAVAQEPTRIEIAINENDPSLGPVDAPITMVEFSDYECPYCRRHFLETAGPLLEKYEGQIRLIFKDFPLTSIHPNAVPAAAAALCAQEQDAYWEFHELLFGMSLGLKDESYLAYADSLALDMESFSKCVEEERYVGTVNENLEYGVNLGVRSTPTFFINGIPVVGAQPLEVFVQIIDTELAALN